jgi:23S rRNA (uridine2552-2'-O)-methyltransferase
VAAPKVGSRGRVIALDLLPILPISKNVTILQGDFLSQSIQEELASVIAKSTSQRSDPSSPQSDHPQEQETASSHRVDSILSDMMANMSGIRARDIEASLELCETALHFARGRLKTGLTKAPVEDAEGKRMLALKDYKGNMLYVPLPEPTLTSTNRCTPSPCSMKFFQHPLLADFKKTQLVPSFEKVIVEKPKESRSGESRDLGQLARLIHHELVQNPPRRTSCV